MKIYQSLADWEGASARMSVIQIGGPSRNTKLTCLRRPPAIINGSTSIPICAKDGPFGGTIAHKYLTLSLIPQLVWEIFKVEGVEASLNYGPNRVRFPAPLPVGSRIRAGVELISLEPTGTGIRETMRVTVERLGGDKPVCVAETVNILIPANGRAGG